MLDEDENLAEYVSNTVRAQFPNGGYSPVRLEAIAATAIQYFGAKNVVFTDTQGNQISSNKYGTLKDKEGIATAATGIVVAGICGITASNYKNIAKTNATAVSSIYNICNDGLQHKKEFPGVEYWEMV